MPQPDFSAEASFCFTRLLPSSPLFCGKRPNAVPNKLTTHLPYVRMTSPSLILVMAFLAISFAARVIRVLMNSLILSTMLALASSSGREGGDLAMIFLNALHKFIF